MSEQLNEQFYEQPYDPYGETYNKPNYLLYGFIVLCVIILIVVVIYFSSSDDTPTNTTTPTTSNITINTTTPTTPTTTTTNTPGVKKIYYPPKLDFEGGCWQGKDGCEHKGVVWGKTGTRPWNRTYGLSCKYSDGKESDKVEIGPVYYDNFNNPKIALNNNGTKPCGSDNNTKLRIYDYTDDANITDITDDMYNFNTVDKYDGVNNYFYDNRQL